MKTTVQIIATERREAVYEGGRKSVNFNCQTVVFGEKTEVGVLRVPEALAKPFLQGEEGKEQLPPGYYELEYGLVVSFKDRSLAGALKSINLVTGSKASPIGVAPQQAATQVKPELAKA